MTTLVTGASGFVGSAVARALLARGESLRLLRRATSPSVHLDALAARGAELVTGDLRDAASLEAALRGCTTLYHVAADYRLWSPRPEELYASNVVGTMNLMRAAAEAGVQRVVYTSSVATLGPPAPGRPSDESTPATLDDMVGHYKRSKYLAELEVRAFAASTGLAVVTVNPSTPVGPGDVKPTPTGRLVRDAALGRVPAFVDTGLNIVHVDDVASGHLLAHDRGLPGERYVLGGEDMTLAQILATIAGMVGRPAPRVRLWRPALYPLALAFETWARLSGGPEPQLTRDGLRMSRKFMYFSSGKAIRDLGYQARPAREALADAVAWFLRGTQGAPPH